MQQAAALVVQFTTDRSFEDYQADVMLRAAVERQFEIIGEALAQLARLDPEIVAKITEHQGIIGFRNVLIHGYALIDHGLVWRTIREKAADLAS